MDLIIRGNHVEIDILKGDGKVWPATQLFRHRSSVSAEKLEIETVWGSKNDLSPSSANVHQPDPFPFPWLETRLIYSARVKYFHQDFVWKHVDHCSMRTTFAWDRQVETHYDHETCAPRHHASYLEHVLSPIPYRQVEKPLRHLRLGDGHVKWRQTANHST